jgi:hypothetical protein
MYFTTVLLPVTGLRLPYKETKLPVPEYKRAIDHGKRNLASLCSCIAHLADVIKYAGAKVLLSDP